MSVSQIEILNQRVIASAAELLATYSEELAQCWIDKPFNRLNLAKAFAQGFLNGRDPAETDPHEHALIIMRVAIRDQKTRALSAVISKNNRG